jgi:hypothetical protein
VSDITGIVDAATAKGTFSVLDVAKGRGYPQDTVDIYMDHASAYEAHKIELLIAETTDDDVVQMLDDQRRALKDDVIKSRLTFHMRGINSGTISGLQKEAAAKFPESDNPGFREWRNEWVNDSYMAAHIVKVVDAAGNEDGHKWTSEEVRDLRGYLPAESFLKLQEKQNELTFAAMYFDETVNADF